MRRRNASSPDSTDASKPLSDCTFVMYEWSVSSVMYSVDFPWPVLIRIISSCARIAGFFSCLRNLPSSEQIEYASSGVNSSRKYFCMLPNPWVVCCPILYASMTLFGA